MHQICLIMHQICCISMQIFLDTHIFWICRHTSTCTVNVYLSICMSIWYFSVKNCTIVSTVNHIPSTRVLTVCTSILNLVNVCVHTSVLDSTRYPGVHIAKLHLSTVQFFCVYYYLRYSVDKKNPARSKDSCIRICTSTKFSTTQV